MRAEDYYEQKLRIQCSQPHERYPNAQEPPNAAEGQNTKEDLGAATEIEDEQAISSEPTNRTAEIAKKTTVPVMAPRTNKSSANKRRKMHKRSLKERLQTEVTIRNDWEKQINRHRGREDTRKTPEMIQTPRLKEELGRGKRMKTKPAKHKDAMEPTERMRRALWKYKKSDEQKP